MTGQLNLGVFGARRIPSTYSGYETFLTVLLPELASRGHRVTMYCRPAEGKDDVGDYRGVARVELPALRSKQLNTLSHGLVAAARARIAGHDVVLAVNVANAAFTLLARASGQRSVLNTDGQEWLRGKWGRFAKTYFRMSARIAGLSSCALVSDSEGMRSIYRTDFHADSTVIPYCWSNLDTFTSCDALGSRGLRSRGYLLVAGRLNPENNIDRVVDAYVHSGISMPLLVLGAANYDSPVARHIHQVAQSHRGIIVGGHVGDRGSFAALLREAAVYIHAHSVGGINPSLLEAMGCGARIIALSTSFNREAAGDTATYFSSFPDDLPVLLRGIEAAGPTAYDELRQRAQQRVLELFNLEAIADAYEELLLAVAEAHPWRQTTITTRWRTAAGGGLDSNDSSASVAP